MKKNRVLVLAQGTGRRWDDKQGRPYLGIPKHYVDVEGEKVIERCIRLFNERNCEVVLVAPENYHDFGADKHVTLKNPHITNTSQDKFIATQPLWDKSGRTTIVWGDCFYTEDAADKIAFCSESGIHYFRRPGPSSVTGHKWDESFAVSFTFDAHGDVLKASERVLKALKTREIRGGDHIFHHYAAYLGLENIADVNAVYNTPGQTVIDDWTDDFDSPREYQEWTKRKQSTRS